MVSILVLMEVALEEKTKKPKNKTKNVSILVLMEVALEVDQY